MLRETQSAAVMPGAARDRHTSGATMALSRANGPAVLAG